MEGLSYSNQEIGTFKVDESSVTAIGSYPTPSLRLWAEPMRFFPIEDQGQKHYYTIFTHDLGLYLTNGRRHGGHFISPIIVRGIPIHSWWTNWDIVEFIAPLDYFKMLRIEKERKGNLSLFVSGDVQIAVHSDVYNEYKTSLSPILGYKRAELELSFRIAQSYWVNKVLASLGHRKFHLIEIDLTECTINAALERISKMECSYDMAQYNDVAVEARELCDYLSLEYLNFSDESDPSLKWTTAISFLKKCASLALHKQEKSTEIGKPFIFTKEDAEFILIHAKVLIRYAQQLNK